jgi:hypothetical protein
MSSGSRTANSVINWILEENQPPVRYLALLELLGNPADDPEVEKARSRIPREGWAHEILSKQKPGGYWESRRSLYRPKYTTTNWMALVLADLGLAKENARIKECADLFFTYWLDEKKDNIFKDEVCVVGNTARMLTRFGYYDDPRVRRLFERLLEDQKEDGGWHCWDPKKGTLDCWEALAAFAAIPESRRTRRIKSSIERGAAFYLERRLVDEGETRYRPWFRFHYPVHYYYDVLVGLDVITQLGYGGDRRLRQALEILMDKRQRDGRWLLDRIHPDPASFAWGKGNLKQRVKPFGLEEEGKPSKWITLTALRVLKRVELAS